jgi:hypothetical protein
MYAWGGFMATFMSVGIVYLIVAPVIYFRLYAAKEQWDRELKRIEEMDEAASSAKSSVAKREPDTLELIQYRNVAMSLFCMTVYLSAMTFQSTIMNPMLTTIYDLPPSKSSLIFTISAVSFVLGAPITM